MVKKWKWMPKRRTAGPSRRGKTTDGNETVSTNGIDDGIRIPKFVANTQIHHHLIEVPVEGNLDEVDVNSIATSTGAQSEPLPTPKDNVLSPFFNFDWMCGTSRYSPSDTASPQHAAIDSVARSQSEPPAASARRRRVNDSNLTEAFECVYGEHGSIMPETRQDLNSIPASSDRKDINGVKSSVGFCRCSATRPVLPHLQPFEWPQAPLLLRPQPNGETRILSIRKESASQSEGPFLWKPGQVQSWWEVLQKEWGEPIAETQPSPAFCEYCVVLPINNGNEKEGESLMVDFETPLFEGTLLCRLRDTHGTTRDTDADDETGFFAGKQIRYQAVLQGRFRQPVSFAHLVTGTRLERSCGKLPPKWLTWTALKVIHFFAPQLQAQLEKTDHPYVLSPLGSAPRVLMVDDQPSRLTEDRTEPNTAAQSILGRDNHVEDPLERARARRRQMDQWYQDEEKGKTSPMPVAQTDKVYTFEFLQHLFDYQKFVFDIGKHGIAAQDLLDGQPLQLMAEAHDQAKLWSFQIWHTSLWDDAMNHINAS